MPSALTALRIHVLQYLSDLEARLALLDFKSTSPPMAATLSPATGDGDAPSDGDGVDVEVDLDLSVQDVTDFVKKGFALLRDIRSDVCSYLPDDLGFASVPSGRSLRERLPLPELHVRHKLSKLGDFEMPAMPALVPSMEEIKSRLKDMSPTGIDPLSYVPRLKAHLQRLHIHFQEFPLTGPSAYTVPLPGLSPPKVLSDLLAELVGDTEEAIQEDIKVAQRAEVTMHEQVRTALEKSVDGCCLIQYKDLPDKWRNNEYVVSGYRFIPSSKWLSLLFSIFQFHNETCKSTQLFTPVNIHSHLLPLLTLSSLAVPYIIPAPFRALVPSWGSSNFHSLFPTLLRSDPTLDFAPATFFTLSAALCLMSSVVWHLCAGCSDAAVMESAARLDYIGIGWLISASVQSGIHYGFHCKPKLLRFYTILCFVTGIAGTFVPLQQWFNERRYKIYRVLFYLGLSFASLLPLTHLALSKGLIATIHEVLPLTPSWGSYFVGLFFYVTHFPERAFPGWFDWGNSHTIWHMFIVLAIRLHYLGLGQLRAGVTASGVSCVVKL
ncbi:hemolysin-III related-domain-containing protein [Cantharellus anzutake]|uniref:hemolysin-III related-domain-containing protein n=1 Tax=Cantharellus anzutake TaxID=1750568 RepID=UPI00190340F0|nr:hemolysin-III related-domain-containing protein [Cantharellus anzutake]KAF8344084.1 hemolysin-III related-domain-containing protein [Cantharellus anzutake]